MKVLSLFDGIGTGRLSLERAGINVDKYYASEIDKNAITIAKTNYSDIIELGSVLNWRNWDIEWNTIDLLIGGSPCTSFSSAGKQQGFNGESKLFFEYRDILNYLKSINPNIKFLLENVIMKKEWEEVITNEVGVKPILIDSSLLSAQQRKRNYWFNWKIEYPEDKHIELKDILDNKDFCYKATIVGRRINNNGHREDYNKEIPIVQCLEVRKANSNKSNCLTTVEKDNVLSNLSYGRYVDAFGKYRKNWTYYSLKEYRRNGSYKKPEGYDYAICNWGNGSLGKVPEYVGQYAQEAYFYCHKSEFTEQMKQLLEFNTIREYVNSISAKRISVMRLYKYLKDNIKGIE